MGGKDVAESCFDFLTIEMVDYIVESSKQGKDAPDLELVNQRLEEMGFSVGQKIVDRYTKDRPRFSDSLEIIKFVCKDLWSEMFKKQIDTLRTNHRGVYVLVDNKFRWLTRVSSASNAKDDALKYVQFPCGLIRGVLDQLGVSTTVTPEITTLPLCSFTVKIKS